MDAAAPKLPITLPLKIRRSAESFAIEDAAGRAVSYIYFEDELSRRDQTRRFSKDEARKIAQMIARLLTDVEAESEGVAGETIPLKDLSADAFRRPSASTVPNKVSVADVLADFDDLRGKQIEVSGFLLMVGENAILYARQGEMTALFVETKHLPRDQRHSIFEKCGGGCEVAVAGKVERVMLNPGLSGQSVTFK